MTDRELCIKLLNNMIEHGYHMFGETPEHIFPTTTVLPIPVSMPETKQTRPM